ncbi:DUF1642 domain-containing protein [Leuconostoc pseudomesenteroides]|uniref:DUF1642 domain-containing protein n=1 Tax=Leuconostoc pseudomesenteroides TaxID=33968 RepID=UPI00111E9354|nr:DUF1642 domain-containing protein [Leuconostoc pseudomesenteroides]TOZ06290.1 hypothetical protein DIS14_05455 [Leuconostoc pseudomesenteroides]
MKFTEEQYQKIIKATESIVNSGDMRLMGANAGISVHGKLLNNKTARFLPFRILENEIMAIVNPLTREWAHDKFVEKEKKYYWNSIKTNSAGRHSRLFRVESGDVTSYSRAEPADNISEDEQLTESEIKSWGYNPEMFDREEVQ